jgi:hypothetical protein
VVALVVLLGCEGGGGGALDAVSDAARDTAGDAAGDAAPDTAPPDAGPPDAAPDAAPPDAAPPDAAPDAAPPDAAPDAAGRGDVGGDDGAGAAADGLDGAGGDGGPPDAATPSLEHGCPGTYARPVTVANLDTDGLLEVSGLAASRRDPTLLWTHQDSGDGPFLYALGVDGRVRARVRLQAPDGAEISARDWEDIAAAPCPDGVGGCLWVGDVGNNTFDRDDLEVLVLPEPELPAAAEVEGETAEIDAVVAWRFPIVYPDEPIDSEALLVAPTGDAFWLVEKTDDEIARLYGHPGPLEDRAAAVLEEVTAFPSPGFPVPHGRMLTAADLHPSGTRLVLRAYTGTWEYRLAGGGDGPIDLGQLATLTPLLVAAGPLDEGQGEAVCYDAEGTGVWTLSEDPRGLGFQPLHHYACRVAPAR